jgi:hypothetical protein
VDQATFKSSTITDVSAKLAWGAVKLGRFSSYFLVIKQTAGGAKVDPATVSSTAKTESVASSLTGGTTYDITIITKWGSQESSLATITFMTSKFWLSNP